MALAEYGNALNIDTDGSGNPILVDPQSGDVIAIYDRASGAWQVTEIEATTGDFDSVNTDASAIDRLYGRSAAGGVTSDRNIPFSGGVSFNAEFQREVFSSNKSDVLTFHRNLFDDGQYRILLFDGPNGSYELHKTRDFSSLTLIDGDVYPNIAAGSGSSFQDHVILPDGRFALYFSDDDTATTVYTGHTLTDISEAGTVVSGKSDCGVILGPDDKIHVYTEDGTTDATSDTMVHYTTPVDDITNETEIGTVVDVSGESWSTGDPDIQQVGGRYYMFADRGDPHPNYYIALWESDDLYNWTLKNPKVTQRYGGDIALTGFGGTLMGFSEFDGADNAGIGLWEFEPIPAARPLDRRGRHPVGIELTPAFESLSGYVTSTAGSGSVTLDDQGVTVSTGSTSGSTAEVGKTDNRYEPRLNFDKRQVMRLGYEGNGGQPSRTDWYQVGSPRDGEKGYALKIEAGDWVGVVHDGTSETTVNMSGAPFGSPQQVWVEHIPGERVEFYFRGERYAEITTGLPSGEISESTAFAHRLFHARIDNSTSSDKSATIHDYRFFQAP